MRFGVRAIPDVIASDRAPNACLEGMALELHTWRLEREASMTEMMMALGCPHCAAGLRARSAFWEGAPLEQLAVALVPFVVVAVASWAMARIGRDASAGENPR
jgi:hypothetical protein